MKLLSLAAAGGLALLAGCAANSGGAQARLDCPAKQGELTRTRVAPDGRTCAYANAAGDALTLKLEPVMDSPEATLARIERTFPTLRTAASTEADDESMESPKAGDRTEVSLPGVHVSASDAGASVRVGGLYVDAGQGAAVVREGRDVRLQGEAFALAKRGYRGRYLVAGDGLPEGYSAFGYVAGGPRKGPLAVAVFKLKDHDRDRVLGDLERLVRRNGGV